MNLPSVSKLWEQFNEKGKQKLGISPAYVIIPVGCAYVTYKGVTLYRNIQKARGPIMYSLAFGTAVSAGLLAYGAGNNFWREHDLDNKIAPVKEKVVSQYHNIQERKEKVYEKVYDKLHTTPSTPTEDTKTD
jgi:hypothetical protein